MQTAASPSDGSARKRYSDTFLQFIAAYPRKIDQSQAFTAFREAMEDGVDPQFMIERAKAYALNVDPTKLQYVPSPKTWIRDRRWEDHDLFTDQFTSTRDWLRERYRLADAASVSKKYGFIYCRPPMPDDVADVDAWNADQRRVWIAGVARHILHKEPLPG